MTAGESAKAEPTVIKVGEGRKRLTKDSLKELAARIRGASGENNPDTKSIWVLYDEPTLIWIAEELERRAEASPPAAEKTALKERILALPIEWDEKRGYHLDEKDVAKAIDAQGVER